jgi:Putative beta barrel porin-7 (BBP7)
MRNGFFGSLIIVVATAGSVLSDEPRSSGPASVPAAAATIDAQTSPLSENGAAPWCPRESCCGNGHIWGSAEFLFWWTKNGNVPPLATAGTPASGGVLGAPGTTTLFDGGLDSDGRPGARFTLGSWLNCDCTKGIEFSYFFLGGNSKNVSAGSSGAAGSAVLTRPFVNVITGQPDVELVAVPGAVAGSVRISSSNNDFQGAEANLLCNLCCHMNCCPTDCCDRSGYRVDLLAGPRYLRLKEDLVITENLTVLPTAPPPFVPGSTISVLDRFETRNTFYGGQIGARAEWQRGRCFVNVLGKVALGNTHQEVRISGTTVFTEPGAAPSVQPGGLLALPTNIGTYSRDEFTVVPEVGINVGYQVTNHLRAFVGYTFLYWSNVVRPGDQIDFGVNPTQLPTAAGPGTLVGPARPAFAFRDTDFWAQGINVGLEFRW